MPTKSSSRGERQLHRDDTLPPIPLATTVRLQPGGSMEIVLQAVGAVGKPVHFLLRTAPTHGVFEGEPRQIDRHSVAVTYVHRAADGPGRDAFTFAAQAPGTAVSAAETVDIEIKGAPAAPDAPAPTGAPDLAARPSELDFGAVQSGRSTGVTLTLENRGNGEASGQLDPPSPWVVDGDASYRLAHGARQTFRLLFLPQAQGSFAETLRIDAGNGNSVSGCIVRLVGTGLPAAARQVPTPQAPAATPAAALVAIAAASPPPAAAVVPTSEAGAIHAAPEIADPGVAVTNEAQVTEVKVLAVGSSTVELAWKPPVPLPSAYRIERRSFARDDREGEGVRIDWLPYDRVRYRVRSDEVTATLWGLVAGEPATLRVVTIDSAGRLSQPSPLLDAVTLPGTGWWHPTTLKVLFLLLVGCLSLVVRQRLRERRQQEELDALHLQDEPSRDTPGIGSASPFRHS